MKFSKPTPYVKVIAFQKKNYTRQNRQWEKES
jgi:hypothetical protein